MVARADPLFTFRALPLVAARLARCGRDPGPLLAAAGVPDAARDEIIAPLSRLIAFIDAAADAVGDRLFGLSLAEAASSISFGYPVFAARTAPTVRAGLQALCELAALVNPVGRFTLTTTPRSATLDYTVSGQRRGLGCHLNEYTLWLILCIASDAVAGGLPLERAWLPHRRDAETTALLRARLRCPVELDAPSLGIAFAPALLEVQPRLADAGLFAFLSARARHELAAIPSEDVIASVIRVIEPRLDDPRLGLRGVARALAITERSLQRRLVDAGTSYREVLDHVRHRRFRQLRRAGATWEAAAAQLGFADARGLRRAVTRWDAP